MECALGTATQLTADLRDKAFRAGHLVGALGLDIALLDIAPVDRLIPLVLGRLGVIDGRIGIVLDSLGSKRIDVSEFSITAAWTTSSVSAPPFEMYS